MKIEVARVRKRRLESVFALLRVNQDKEGKHRMPSDFQVFLWVFTGAFVFFSFLRR